MSGKQYKRARERLKLSRAELAAAMGITERSVYRIEDAKTVSKRDALAMEALTIKGAN